MTSTPDVRRGFFDALFSRMALLLAALLTILGRPERRHSALATA